MDWKVWGQSWVSGSPEEKVQIYPPPPKPIRAQGQTLRAGDQGLAFSLSPPVSLSAPPITYSPHSRLCHDTPALHNLPGPQGLAWPCLPTPNPNHSDFVSLKKLLISESFSDGQRSCKESVAFPHLISHIANFLCGRGPLVTPMNQY